jgi:hypothetical protein
VRSQATTASSVWTPARARDEPSPILSIKMQSADGGASGDSFGAKQPVNRQTTAQAGARAVMKWQC